jgi:hypothetical protein
MDEKSINLFFDLSEWEADRIVDWMIKDIPLSIISVSKHLAKAEVLFKDDIKRLGEVRRELMIRQHGDINEFSLPE